MAERITVNDSSELNERDPTLAELLYPYNEKYNQLNKQSHVAFLKWFDLNVGRINDQYWRFTADKWCGPYTQENLYDQWILELSNLKNGGQ